MTTRTIRIALTESEMQQLLEQASIDCRRPQEQARYFLLNALGLATSNNVCAQKNSKSSGQILADCTALAG